MQRTSIEDNGQVVRSHGHDRSSPVAHPAASDPSRAEAHRRRKEMSGFFILALNVSMGNSCPGNADHGKRLQGWLQ
eukprot:912048-Pyramimonas_sp.AAC.1